MSNSVRRRNSDVSRIVFSRLALGMAISASVATQAQTPPGNPRGGEEGSEAISEVVVTGVRESLRSAQAIKQDANQIVDSVQAQDIGKLPDANTTEALQRITGSSFDVIAPV